MPRNLEADQRNLGEDRQNLEEDQQFRQENNEALDYKYVDQIISAAKGEIKKNLKDLNNLLKEYFEKRGNKDLSDDQKEFIGGRARDLVFYQTFAAIFKMIQLNNIVKIYYWERVKQYRESFFNIPISDQSSEKLFALGLNPFQEAGLELRVTLLVRKIMNKNRFPKKHD